MNSPAERHLSFIVFSDDWGVHPSSCQHLFRQIARDHAVLWVNTIGMRRPNPSLADLKKVFRKLSRTFRGSATQPSSEGAALRLRVCQPFMLPYSSLSLVRLFNAYSVRRTVRRLAREMGLARPTLVSTVPNACDYAGHLDEGKVVYYCVDDFTQWPGLEHDLVTKMEDELISRSDELVATSRQLYRKLEKVGKPTHLLTHGVDLGLFAREAIDEHACLANIPKPRAGYFGLFDERSDQGVIAAVASQMPDFSFVFTGPVATEKKALENFPNVFFTGPVPYLELPSLVKGLDALFIPYLVNQFTESISPLKLKEYLMTGKPVIATPMAETMLQEQYLTIARTTREWEAGLRAALSVDLAARQQPIRKMMAGESWDRKAAEFVQICMGRGKVGVLP
jgi:glycosyltransferase involved in cell wall biosynthesis